MLESKLWVLTRGTIPQIAVSTQTLPNGAGRWVFPLLSSGSSCAFTREYNVVNPIINIPFGMGWYTTSTLFPDTTCSEHPTHSPSHWLSGWSAPYPSSTSIAGSWTGKDILYGHQLVRIIGIYWLWFSLLLSSFLFLLSLSSPLYFFSHYCIGDVSSRSPGETSGTSAHRKTLNADVDVKTSYAMPSFMDSGTSVRRAR
jgi:hypothetical protein